MRDKHIIESAKERARIYFDEHPQENLDDEALLALALEEMHIFLDHAEGRRATRKQRILYYETWQEAYLDVKSKRHFAEYLESRLLN